MHIHRNFFHPFVLTQDTFLALGVFSMATCKAETTNNSPTSMESQMEEQSRCLCYPREDSPLAWLTQAHWACGQVTIKKVIFLPDVQSSQTETNLCKIPGFSTSWLYFCISMKPEVGSSLEKVKTESQEEPLTQRRPPSSDKMQCPVTHRASTQALSF